MCTPWQRHDKLCAPWALLVLLLILTPGCTIAQHKTVLDSHQTLTQNPGCPPFSQNPQQVPWKRPTVNGLSRLPDGRMDQTEGVGAFLNLPLVSGTRNLDVGGGAHDANTTYLATRGIVNYVYDPFSRSIQHNSVVLAEVTANPVDTATSMSVLNVIDRREARLEHIKLCHQVLKAGGKAYFKVWPGNRSGIGQILDGGYQSNRGAESYLTEVAQIFGQSQVQFDSNRDALVAQKLPQSLQLLP